MRAWRILCLLGCAAGLISSACAVQPLTPGPGALVAVAQVTVAPLLPPTLPPAAVVQADSARIEPTLPASTATPPLPTAIPYLTPTPVTPTVAVVVLDNPAQSNLPTAAPRIVAPTEVVITLLDPTATDASVVIEPSSTAPAAAASPAAPPSGDAAAAELYMVDLINQQRIAAGVAPLIADPLLMSVARGRVDDMVARGYTGHSDPATGESLGPKMIHAAGFTSTFVGENWYGTIKPPPSNVETAMSWFMTDPPHARNILSPYYAYVGVGLAFNGRQWLIVQNFAGLN